MSFTRAQKSDLILIRQHGARLVERSSRMGDYTWTSGDKNVGATIYRLANKGAVSIEGHTAAITSLGEQVSLERDRYRKAGSRHVNAQLRANRAASRAA